MQTPLWSYVGGIARGLESTPLEIGGTADHLHALVTLPRTLSVADLIREFKTGSSHWAKEQGLAGFSWQAGYGALSVSESNTAAVVSYIEGQADHHRQRGFQEEYRAFLKRDGISFDERFVWE